MDCVSENSIIPMSKFLGMMMLMFGRYMLKYTGGVSRAHLTLKWLKNCLCECAVYIYVCNIHVPIFIKRDKTSGQIVSSGNLSEKLIHSGIN